MELDSAFVSGQIDFCTDPSRKEQFGVFILRLLAKKYSMAKGLELFMSDETRQKLVESLLSSPSPELLPLKFPVNFERFLEEKTCTNVSDWMFESLESAEVKEDDFNHLSADGGSNAIGSIQEWEVVSREEGGASGVSRVQCLLGPPERTFWWLCIGGAQVC